MESNALTIVEPESKELEVQGVSLLQRAQDLTVNDDESFREAGEIITASKKGQKAVEWLYAESIAQAHKLHKMLCGKSNLLSDPMVAAEREAKRKAGAYQMEIERKRREEAERLRKDAEAKAEAERMAKAQEQMDKGDLKGCEKTLQAPLKVETPRVMTPEPPKLAGVSFREDWKFEITNVNEIPMEYMIPDDKAIARVVKALGSKANIPGIRIYSEKSVSGRAA